MSPKILFCALSLVFASACFAGPGHDHGDAPAAAAGPGLPRFALSTELFELVGVLDGQTLSLYLDQAATNEPVRKAQIELELAGKKVAVQEQADGSYRSQLAEPPTGELLPVTATVTAGESVDLLAGELHLEHAAHADEHSHGSAWRWGAGAAVAGALALAAALLVQRRRARGLGVGA